jgi:two-component system chemotaxis sensor kinase CheA
LDGTTFTMPRKSKKRIESTATPGSAETHARVDGALNRLVCDFTLSRESAEDAVARAAQQIAELAAEVRALGSRVLEPLIGTVMAATEPAALEGALAIFSDAWALWKVRGDVESAPVEVERAVEEAAPMKATARVDEDVAALKGDPELSGMFIGEALDHLSSIEAIILQLEAAPGDVKLLNDMFRPFHTVKGNASALGVATVEELAHKVENLLDLCRSGRHTLGPAETDAVLEAVDVLTALVSDLQARLAGRPGTDLEPRRHALMAVVDRLVAGPTSIDDPTPDVQIDVREPVAVLLPDPAPKQIQNRRVDDVAGQASVKVDTQKLDNLVDMVGELVIAQSILQEDPVLLKAADERLSRNLAQLKRITSDLQRNAMSLRMVPIRQTFQKMARLVRDLSKKSGKSVDLVLSGEDTELDRRIVEDINDPLMHMVRNSVDHGIEDPVRRAHTGKRLDGRLALSAYHQGGNIVIEIEDDGAGLDTAKILAKGISRGLVRADESLSPSEIHQLIFQPGFSTAEKITEISGRGVGMDVVRRNIEALRGRIEIQTTLGVGTTFRIKLPLTLAILDGLVLSVGSERFVMPTFAIRESLRPTREQVHSVAGQPCMIQVRDRLIPLVWLGTLFAIGNGELDPWDATVVVIEDDGRQVGLVIDRLLGKQEVVIKALGEAFGDARGVAGGAILGDGRVGLILDAHGIVGCTRSDVARAA